MTVVVRPATPADRAAIERVVSDAFSDDTRDAGEELDIVRQTWARRAGAACLDLVATDAGQLVVGHVLAATGDLDGHPVAGVAPLSVAPTHQRAGVGTALMEALIGAAAQRGWATLVLLGDPAYYTRFGFVPAASRGIHYGPAGRDSPHFLVRLDDDGAGAALPGGEYRYCWEL